jgi:bifunctional non-homologous end joining protein LigD
MKWDGYRAIATITFGRIDLWSRNGLSLNKKYDPIVAELSRLKFKSAILDGEIVVLDDEGVPRFELLQRFQSDRKGELTYFVFDLL